MKKNVLRFEVVPLHEVLSKTARDAARRGQAAPAARLDEELVAERAFEELSERVFHPGRKDGKQDGKK